MLHWQIEKIILELKYAWKISRNTSNEKVNLIVKVSDGITDGSGEAAPNVRYNESPETLEREFELFLAGKPEEINSIPSLEEYLSELQLSNALRFAIESAFIHYDSQKRKTSVCDMLGISAPESIHTSFSIPIMDIGAMKNFYEENHLERFPFIKIKIDAQSGDETVRYLNRFCPRPVIVDANEAFADVEACIYFLEKIKRNKIEFVEQPLSSSMTEESIYLKKYSPFRLFADESVISSVDFGLLKNQFDGVNVKMMKAGGYINAVRLLREAKQNGMQTMIGCMVETTLGISSAMNLCVLADYVDLDSFLLVKNEPYKKVREESGQLFFDIDLRNTNKTKYE